MEFRIWGQLAAKDRARWDRLWLGLARVGDLSSKEVEKIADAARLDIGDHFTREQSPTGQPWHPLAPMTQKERARGVDHRGIPFRVAPEHPILQRTKDLRQSFENPRHPRNVYRIERGDGIIRVELGATDDPETPDRIERLHSGGKTSSGRVIPPRPFVGLSRRGFERIDKSARFVIGERVKRL